MPGGGLLQGGVSAPGGGLHPRGGVCCGGGVLHPSGGVCSRGGSPCQGGSGKENPPPPGWENPPPPVNRMTDRCKNITLAKTSFRPVIRSRDGVPLDPPLIRSKPLVSSFFSFDVVQTVFTAVLLTNVFNTLDAKRLFSSGQTTPQKYLTSFC